jgi:hypothetical protein
MHIIPESTQRAQALSLHIPILQQWLTTTPSSPAIIHDCIYNMTRMYLRSWDSRSMVHNFKHTAKKNSSMTLNSKHSSSPSHILYMSAESSERACSNAQREQTLQNTHIPTDIHISTLSNVYSTKLLPSDHLGHAHPVAVAPTPSPQCSPAFLVSIRAQLSAVQ